MHAYIIYVSSRNKNKPNFWVNIIKPYKLDFKSSNTVFWGKNPQILVAYIYLSLIRSHTNVSRRSVEPFFHPHVLLTRLYTNFKDMVIINSNFMFIV